MSNIDNKKNTGMVFHRAHFKSTLIKIEFKTHRRCDPYLCLAHEENSCVTEIVSVIM